MKIRTENLGIFIFLMFIIGVVIATLAVPALKGESSPGGAPPALLLAVGGMMVLVFGLFAWAMIAPIKDRTSMDRAFDWLDRFDSFINRRKF